MAVTVPARTLFAAALAATALAATVPSSAAATTAPQCSNANACFLDARTGA